MRDTVESEAQPLTERRRPSACPADEDKWRPDPDASSTPATGLLNHRAAAILLVLFGQPYHRSIELHVDDVEITNTGVGIRVGQDVTPLPPPFDQVFIDLVDNRANMETHLRRPASALTARN